MRQLSAAPDWVVGSVHAVTEDGSLLIASASGSQLGPIVSGAGHVILVIGGQKIVANLTAGLRRIYEYCFPLEDRRARQAYSVPSGVNSILIINRAPTPGRVSAILVNKTLGFWVWFDEAQWRPVLFYSVCRPATFKVRLPMAAPLRLAAHRRQPT